MNYRHICDIQRPSSVPNRLNEISGTDLETHLESVPCIFTTSQALGYKTTAIAQIQVSVPYLLIPVGYAVQIGDVVTNLRSSSGVVISEESYKVLSVESHRTLSKDVAHHVTLELRVLSPLT